VPQLFTLNFMRCWMNNLSSPDRYLHKVAVQVARRVQDVVKSNPSVGFALLATLVGKHGWPDFDRVTKTKTVETIMGSLNAKGVTEYVEYLEKVITTTEEEHEYVLSHASSAVLDKGSAQMLLPWRTEEYGRSISCWLFAETALCQGRTSG